MQSEKIHQNRHLGPPRTDGTVWMAVGDPMDRPNRPGDNGYVLDCGEWMDSTIV